MRIAIAMCVAFGALASQAHASNTFYIDAATCTPADTAIQGNQYTIQSSHVFPKSTITGTVSLYCPVPSDLAFTPSSLYLIASDSDQTAGADYVAVTYWKMARSNGAITAIKTWSTDSWLTAQDGLVHEKFTSFTDTYDGTQYLYYFRIDIFRNSTANTVVFYAAGLQ